MIGILGQPHPITPHISAAQMKNMHIESFNTANLAFDVGYGGHVLIESLIQLCAAVNGALRLATQLIDVCCDRIGTSLKRGVEKVDLSSRFNGSRQNL